MFVMHIDLHAKKEKEQDLEQTFADLFRSAISRQDGFRGVELLRSVDDATLYCLTIAFESPEMQQKWTTTDLHEEVWPVLQNLCTGYSLRKYNRPTSANSLAL